MLGDLAVEVVHEFGERRFDEWRGGMHPFRVGVRPADVALDVLIPLKEFLDSQIERHNRPFHRLNFANNGVGRISSGLQMSCLWVVGIQKGRFTSGIVHCLCDARSRRAERLTLGESRLRL